MKELLTERQFQMLELHVWGKSRKEISNALGVSPFTVDRTLDNSFKALGVSPTEVTEMYLVRHLGVPAEKNPLPKYDFRPRITLTKVVKEVCKCTVTLLLLTGAWIEITTAHDDILRTVRNCRSARARIGRPVRRSSETPDFYLNLINIDYQ